MPEVRTPEEAAPSVGRGLVIGAVLGVSAGVTGALLGYAWMAATGADMGLWVVARASGLASYLLLTAVTIAGLLMASPPRSAARFIGAAQRLRVHVLLAIFALVFVVLHVVVLAIDPWAEVGWWGALVTFGSEYRPLPVTLGLLALSRIQVDTPLAFLVLPIALLGLGLGVSGPARTSVIISTPPPRLIGSGAAINSAAGQSGYALGVIISSFLVTVLADGALRAQLRRADLPVEVMTQLESVWKNAFARALSGTYTVLSPEAAQWITAQFGPAFTSGLAQTLLIMAGFVTAAAILIFVGMPRGLQGSLITLPQKPAELTDEPRRTA